VLVECNVIVNHQPSYRPGKYGITVAQPSPYGETVKEVPDDQTLLQLLECLGYSTVEAHQILKELGRRGAEHSSKRSIDDAVLTNCGFRPATRN
jgi:hypothetical protein